MESLNSSDYSLRKLGKEDWIQYRNIRLEALQTEPGMFGNSHAKELEFSDETWISRLENPATAVFGLFDENELIGITAVFREHETITEGYMTQSYIRKAYRGKNLSRLFYSARIEWAKNNGITKLIIGHRKSNVISKAANQRFGFVFTHAEMRSWPDGSEEEMLYYQLIIKNE